MKKILAFVSVVLIVCFMSLSVFADNGDTYIYEYGSKTVVFEENTPFDSVQRERIAALLANGETQQPAPCGILCLFGHNYVTSSVSVITHEVYSTQPKCMEEEFEVSECTRCDKTKVEQIGTFYIVCCVD